MESIVLKNYPGVEFRIKDHLPPLEVFALSTQVDFDDFDKTLKLSEYALEHMEVKIGERWLAVKERGANALNPLGIDEDMNNVAELVHTFAEKVIFASFTKSEE